MVLIYLLFLTFVSGFERIQHRVQNVENASIYLDTVEIFEPELLVEWSSFLYSGQLSRGSVFGLTFTRPYATYGMNVANLPLDEQCLYFDSNPNNSAITVFSLFFLERLQSDYKSISFSDVDFVFNVSRERIVSQLNVQRPGLWDIFFFRCGEFVVEHLSIDIIQIHSNGQISEKYFSSENYGFVVVFHVFMCIYCGVFIFILIIRYTFDRIQFRDSPFVHLYSSFLIFKIAGAHDIRLVTHYVPEISMKFLGVNFFTIFANLSFVWLMVISFSARFRLAYRSLLTTVLIAMLLDILVFTCRRGLFFRTRFPLILTSVIVFQVCWPHENSGRTKILNFLLSFAAVQILSQLVRFLCDTLFSMLASFFVAELCSFFGIIWLGLIVISKPE